MKKHRHSEGLQFLSGWVIFPLAMVVALPVPAFFFWLADLMPFLALVLVPLGLFVWFAAGGILTMLATHKLHVWFNRGRQDGRQAESLALLERVRHGEPVKPFFLYLRSFKLETMQCAWYSDPSDALAEIHSTTVDDELSAAMEEVGALLVCLGDNGDTKLGAARIKTADADWRSIVTLLMTNATGIILMPGHTDSLIEETKTLFATPALLRKTAFLMMPRDTMLAPGVYWSLISESLQRAGITLPAYNPSGLVFNAYGFQMPIIGKVSGPASLAGLVVEAMHHADKTGGAPAKSSVGADESTYLRHRVALTGWRHGALSVSAIQAIRDHSDLGLAGAKHAVDQCLGGVPVQIETRTFDEARSLASKLDECRFVAQVEN